MKSERSPTAGSAPDTEEAADRQQKQLFMRRCGPGGKKALLQVVQLGWHETVEGSTVGMTADRPANHVHTVTFFGPINTLFSFMWLLCPIQTEKSELM